MKQSIQSTVANISGRIRSHVMNPATADRTPMINRRNLYLVSVFQSLFSIYLHNLFIIATYIFMVVYERCVNFKIMVM